MKRLVDKAKQVDQYRERIYQIVRRIPRGRVMTYGQIAYILGQAIRHALWDSPCTAPMKRRHPGIA